jgi:hypothetical protein
MSKHNVTIFKPYPFELGQKIRLQGGPRKGDWEVIGMTERKVTLRCPLSLKEFAWNRFCYSIEELKDEEWPKED